MSLDLASYYLLGGGNKGGGGSRIKVEELTVTANGTYTAERGSAYSPVTVNVPSVNKLKQMVMKTITSVGADELTGITYIGAYAFYASDLLANVVVPEGAVSVDQSAFEYCAALAEISLPETMRTMGINAFHGCSSLTSITLPAATTTISAGAFNGCSSLTSVVVKAETPPTLVNTSAFAGTASGMTIYVPSASVEAYKTATNWTAYAGQIQAISA